MELYPNIVNSGPTTWTPTDVSGAGLSFTVAGASYYRIGKMVVASFRLTFPVTADGSNVTISGLPFNTATIGGNFLYGASPVWTDLGANAVLMALYNPNAVGFNLINSAGALVINSALSTHLISGTITYFTN